MLIETVISLCRSFAAERLAFWVDGGWGVDALLAKQTRPHNDLDLGVHLADMPQFAHLLLALGYGRVLEAEFPDWNWVFRHETEGAVDLHGFVLNDRGEGILGEPSANSMYPAGSLDGVGMLGEMQVQCIAAPFVLMFRDGFEPRDVDRQDVANLCDHFGLAYPSRFLPPVKGK
jgi:lincosamide nucleotidyltransferase A/C/D/E